MKLPVGSPVLADPHVTGRDPHDGTLIVIEHLRRGEAWIDVDAECFRPLAQKLRDVGQRADEIAVVRHQCRHQRVRKTHSAGLREEVEAILAHFGLQRPLRIVAPVGQQGVERGGVHDEAGEDVRADLPALLQHDDGEVAVELL